LQLTNGDLIKRIEELESAIKGNEAALADRDTRIEDLERTIEEFERALEDRERALEEKEAQIQQIQSGHGWRLLAKYYTFRERLLPHDTKRRRFARTIFSTILSAGQTLKRIKRSPRELVQFQTSPSKTPLVFDNLSNYADTVLLPESPGHLLVVDEQVPSPDQDAGSARMYAMLKLLREMDFTVTFVSSSESRSPDSERKLAQLGVRVLYGYSATVAHLARQGYQYEFVLLSRPDVALRFLPAVRAYALNSTVIYDTVDVHSVRFRRAATLSGDPALAREADRYQQMERLNAVCSDLVLAVTQEDKASLLAVAPNARIDVIPTIHTLMPPSDLGQERKGLMFVGNFQHAPNADAVTWFVKEVFPLIQRQLTGIVFHVIGGKAPEDVTTLASPSVRIAGYVPDLEPYFRSSRVFVAPLRYGAGMKGKIGQSMSYGLPVVTTSVGAEGIMLQDGETALIADSPEAFAQAVVHLYTDDLRWKKIADNSLEHIRTHFSEEAIKPRLATIFTSLRDGGRAEISGAERAA